MSKISSNRQFISESNDIYKQRTIVNFNKIANDYDTSLEGKQARTIYPFVLKKLDYLTYHSILDVGCGTGTILSAIAKRKDDGVILAGIDISPEMIRVAKKHMEEKADLRVGDAEDLPWKDNSFDVALCLYSFHHYTHPQKALSEINRVITQGGQLILADAWIFSPLRQILNLFIRFSNKGDVRIYSKAEICNLIKDAGFNKVSWERVTPIAPIAFLVVAGE
jgi:ubiquinone/menaquinone biosynthesis C-methylase UbiE